MPTRPASRDPRAVALGALLLTAAALAVITATIPALAARIAEEGHILETVQWLLTLAAVVPTARAIPRLRRAGRSIAFEVVVAAVLVAIVAGEVDLDKRIFGTKIISTRFFVDASVALVWRVLAAVALLGTYVAFAVYLLLNLRALWRAALAALREPWGQVLAAGVLVFGLTEAFEKPLGRVPGLPRNFMEEALELVASIGFVVALFARPSRRD